MQRRISLMLAVCGLGLIVVGCASSQRESMWWHHRRVSGMTNTNTMTESMPETIQRYKLISNQDARALLDDIDLALMRQHPTRLTRWHTR